MSCHSRSSSELCEMGLADCLAVHFEDFRKDFDFADVSNKGLNFLTQRQQEIVCKNDDREHQVFILFRFLNEKSDKQIDAFLKVIEPDYHWLVKAVRSERQKWRDTTESYRYERTMLLSENQKFIDYNVFRFGPYMKLRNALLSLKWGYNVVLLGDLGLGKKWLTIDVCSEYDVLKAMNFKIFWLDVNDCKSTEEEIRSLHKFLILLNGAHSLTPSPVAGNSMSLNGMHILNRKEDLKQRIKNRLKEPEYKNCLLVLVNVRNVSTLDTFTLGCKRLIVTRYKEVSESLSTAKSDHIMLDKGLLANEFYDLFEKYLKIDRNQFPENAEDILRYSEGNPYLLSIIAQNLSRNKTDWNMWIEDLKRLNIKNDKFNAVIKLSLNVLNPEEMELFKKCVIFPHSVAIPVKLLGVLWNRSDDVDSIVEKFYNLSILNKSETNKECTVPLVYNSYLKSSHQVDLKMLHRKVINYYEFEKFLDPTVHLSNNEQNSYFYNCIAYHLNAAECSDQLSKLYLDFNFLENKIRHVDLPSTICDLKRYRHAISGKDNRRQQLVDDLCEFLPKVEEKLVLSKGTRLLQYALMESGSMYEEARRQVKKYPDKVWFTERGNFHQRIQIANLPDVARIVITLEQDICLIVLDDNSIILADISLDCNNGHVFLVDKDNRSKGKITSDDIIKEAHLFDKKRYVVTLHADGKLKVWSIESDQQHKLVSRRSSKQKVHPLNLNKGSHVRGREYIQLIDKRIDGKAEPIVAFHIEENPNYNETILHLAFRDGVIYVYKWDQKNRKFDFSACPPLPTGIPNIRCFIKCLGKYYMILDKKNVFTWYDLKNSSMIEVPFKWPQTDMERLVCCEVNNTKTHTHIYFVFVNMVVRVTFELIMDINLNGNVDIIYPTEDTSPNITSAKVSEDGKYLVLGTERGLIVIDAESKDVIGRSKISEHVTSVDIHKLDDGIFKYIVMFGVKNKKVLNIFALRCMDDGLISWSHNMIQTSNRVSNDPQLEPAVSLRGGKLCNVTYKDDGSLILLAADTRNRIHQMIDNSSIIDTKAKNWSIVMPSEGKSTITALAVSGSCSLVGYENGEIFNLKDETFIDSEFIKERIEHLEIIDDKFMIVANSSNRKTWIRNMKTSNQEIYDSCHVKQTYKLYDDRLLMVVDSGFWIIDSGSLKVLDRYSYQHSSISGWDFKNSQLFLAEVGHDLHVFTFNNGISFEYMKYEHSSFDDNSKVTCLTVSDDGSVIAAGYNTGNIEIYQKSGTSIKIIWSKLESHCSPIYGMKFSPLADVLVSCSEQLCFWSVTYIINNIIETSSSKRRSSRFSSQRSQSPETVDATQMQMNLSGLKHKIYTDGVFDEVGTKARAICPPVSPYQDKSGFPNQPELLACIKFDGNRAKKFFTNDDFTQFNAIDDEGVYYHLTLLQPSQSQENFYVTSTCIDGWWQDSDERAFIGDGSEDVID